MEPPGGAHGQPLLTPGPRQAVEVVESVDAQGLEALSSGSVPAVSDAVVAELGSTMAGLELECKGTGATAPSSKPAEASSILKLKGLPYSTSEREIRDFFAGYEVKGIRFVFEPDGRPSGLAFAEFGSRDEALKALTKNGDFMGERYVRLLHVPETEMEEQVRLGTLAIPGKAAKLRSRMVEQQQQKRLPFMQQQPMQLVPTMVPSAMYMMPPPPLYQGGMHQHQLQRNPSTHSFSQGSQQVPTHFGRIQPPPMPPAGRRMPPRPPMLSQSQAHPARGAGMQPGGLQGDMQSGMQGAGMHGPLPPQLLRQQQGVPVSATVKVRGLPYRSTPAEILHFFHGYQYLPDSLQIGLDSLSRPSGEAWLTFVTPAEALRAVNDLNRHYLGNRYLELSLC